MSVYVTGASLSSCLGSARETYQGLIDGRSHSIQLTYSRALGLTFQAGYQSTPEAQTEAWFLLEPHLQRLASTVSGGLLERTMIIVGTGMHEQLAMELSVLDDPRDAGVGVRFPEDCELDSRDGVRVSVPVMTLSGACSASGTALALAMDFLDQRVTDCVIVAGVDVIAVGMLGMMGRVNPHPPQRLTPFDSDSAGVLLGEGAAAIMLRTDPGRHKPLAEILGTAISCDAFHETAPDPEGIENAIRMAHTRAGLLPDEVDLVVAHGTGTALNDPMELQVLSDVFDNAKPLVTAIKGGTGHTSGASMLMSLIIAVCSLEREEIPSVVGLSSPRAEAAEVHLLTTNSPPRAIKDSYIAQVEAFGFGGVNAVALVSVSGESYDCV